ncbi:c-type cytochrome [Rhizobium laguerreae]|uniref:cytochrome-c peroxidase n=1 Tax=Rhizobium laguerreae TaxID=1076926 RepID=UPI001440FC73|nr:cytochrome c peroxidase [Rhizobium laguerreae]MBY3088333.1 c-type cytochrome [Rhizobium laguerreae]MBY3095643.1 c-type cytochrome [Rhizobium laguerreae]MBY3102802.1 c-type cytochrome [Rhizobium laguerreae]MBY3109216.1 c-type cytochrome [Rhizobium laguerreae]MBY3130000.1 c-type cytochrome [Rhizobium laguerreae]
MSGRGCRRLFEKGTLRTVLLAVFVVSGGVFTAAGDVILGGMKQEALLPLPDAPQLDPGRVELGKRLFHDKLLSKRREVSCSSCHDLATGGTIHAARTIGYEGKMHAFNAPTIFNVGNNYRLGWRGKFTSLVSQNDAIIHDSNLLAMDWPTLLSRLNSDRSYADAFSLRYGGAAERENVLDALVSYQRSLATPDAPFDRFLKGDKKAITPLQKHGLKLFTEYGCVSCHQGSNIGGNMFQIFGVFGEPGAETFPTPEDLDARLDAADRNVDVFRVPSLRNVALTAPYFHDGRTATLRDAIAIMGRSQLGRRLTESDVDALEAFLNSLTGVYSGKKLTQPNTEESR